MAGPKTEPAAGAAPSLQDIMAKLEKMSEAFNLLADDTQARFETLEAKPAASPAMADPSMITSAVSAAMQPFLARLDDVERRSVNPQDEAQRKALYEKDLAREAGKEQAANGGKGVLTFYHPDPAACAAAKRPISIPVRTADQEAKARKDGYFGSLEDAAQAALGQKRFATLEDARSALHAAAGAAGDTHHWGRAA